jgi:ankyrin repeat protein
VLAEPLGIPISAFQDLDSSGRLPLHYAASNDQVDSARWILQESKELGLEVKDIVNKPSCDNLHQTPIQLATQQGRLSMVNLLLDAIGDDLDLVLSLMPLAVRNSQQAVFATLEKRSRDSTTILSPAQKEIILEYAISMDNKEATLKLLGDPTTTELSAESLVLHQAVEIQSLEIVETLVQRKADINARNSEGRSPLHIAASLGNDPILLILLHARAKVNQLDKMGRTPLHLASLHGFFRTCTHLLDHGSNVNLFDNLGRLPAHYACDIGHDKLLKLLLEKGSDTLITDK